MPHYTDISAFGRTEANGALQEFNTDDECVSNALVALFSLETAEVIYNPGLGGILRRTLFKVMTPDRIKAMREQLSRVIEAYFSDAVALDGVSITQSPTDSYRYLIEIRYRSKLTNTNILVKIPATPPPEPIQQFIDVFYVEENAELFVEIQLPRFRGQLLTKNDQDGLYYWGPFRFVNMKDTDVKFPTIRDMIKANLG